jgi:hypothetical protein
MIIPIGNAPLSGYRYLFTADQANFLARVAEIRGGLINLGRSEISLIPGTGPGKLGLRPNSFTSAAQSHLRARPQMTKS